MKAEEAIRQWAEGWNSHDPATFARAYAETTVTYDPAQAQPLHGKDAVAQDAQEFFRAFPDLKVQAVRVLDKGDRAAVEASFTGTHKGPLTGPAGQIPPTNRRIEMRGMAFFRLNSQGLVTEERRYYDTGAMLSQLGLTQGL